MKNIIITGASQGIGYYITEQLLSDGYNVTVLDLTIESLNNLSQQYSSLLPIVCDVRDLTTLKAAIEESINKFGPIDCAIHNACICTFDSMEETDESIYKEVFDVNYFGALHLAQSVLPHMKNQGSGKVIFTSSGVGVMGFVNISPYASSKGAIESLAKCLNIEYQEHNISFHLFQPPLTYTKSAEPLPVPKEFMADPQKVGTGLAKHINKQSFIICHNWWQKVQTMMCYMIPIKMGKLMSKMTANYKREA